MNNNAVAFCVTGSHLQYTAVAITSVLQHYHHEVPLKILVVCDDIMQADIDLIRSLATKMNHPQATIDFWAPPVWVKDLKPYPMNGRTELLPAMVFWRLFLPAYYPTYKKILYLDNDVLVNTDVSLMFDLLDDKYPIAAVGDFLFNASKTYNPNTFDSQPMYGLQSLRNYFNDGVLLINVQQYNDRFNVDQILSLIKKTSWNLGDQTLLNIMFGNETKLLPYRYNYQHTLKYFSDPYFWDPDLIKPLLSEHPYIAIRHFAGEGPVSAPYEHVSVGDKWEAMFWRLMNQVKEYSMADNNL